MKLSLFVYGVAVIAFALGWCLRGLIALGDQREIEELRSRMGA